MCISWYILCLGYVLSEFDYFTSNKYRSLVQVKRMYNFIKSCIYLLVKVKWQGHPTMFTLLLLTERSSIADCLLAGAAATTPGTPAVTAAARTWRSTRTCSRASRRSCSCWTRSTPASSCSSSFGRWRRPSSTSASSSGSSSRTARRYSRSL